MNKHLKINLKYKNKTDKKRVNLFNYIYFNKIYNKNITSVKKKTIFVPLLTDYQIDKL